MADYPTKKLAEQKGNPGLSGPVVDSGLEGRQEPSETIRPNKKGEKGKEPFV